MYENGVKSDNARTSATYSGWIDLFCWGTSGWNSGAPNYQPWSRIYNEANQFDFFHAGDLSGEYANADWGVYNQIGEDLPGTWRTPSNAEWIYIVSRRPDADSLRGLATVNGVPGLVLLPDCWSEDAIPFRPGIINFDSIDWSIAETYSPLKYAVNSYSASQWSMLEEHGAIFLPAAGNRSEYSYEIFTNESSKFGHYWSSTFSGVTTQPLAYTFLFNDLYYSDERTTQQISWGLSVRLVRDITNYIIPNDHTPTNEVLFKNEGVAPTKIFNNGQVYILLPNGQVFDSTGKRVE